MSLKFAGMHTTRNTDKLVDDGHIEHDLDDLWYKIMEKRINSMFWPVWILILALDLTALILFLSESSDMF